MFNGLRIFGALGEMPMRWGLQPSGFGRRKEKKGGARRERKYPSLHQNPVIVFILLCFFMPLGIAA